VSLLMADDEPENLRLGLETLRVHGFEVLVALNGADGLRIARSANPDLILLDIRMPGLDGFGVCEQLRADPVTASTPVIFVSALEDIDDKVRGFGVGGVDYITKPFDARELLLRVITHLRLARRLADERSPGAAPRSMPAAISEWVEAPARLPESAAVDARALSILLCARDRLRSDLTRDWSQNSLAHACATNRTTLQRLFRSHLGLGVAAYLREQRLLRARELLGEPDATVEWAAAQVGYSNGRDLARAFRARFGVSPRAFCPRAD
jgi:DNA-binding response OmpR family regulator